MHRGCNQVLAGHRVTHFADPESRDCAARLSDTGYKPQIGSNVDASSKPVRIADGAVERERGKRTNARYFHEAAADIDVDRHIRKFAIQVLNIISQPCANGENGFYIWSQVDLLLFA
ncbi:peptidase [Sphingopyxis macrogoltabida]|uniref:Peptidase n=1 Tax=Sphingopyxis macrogoltabida TaxID=33050 RepID=A0AAC8Z065_SPHMC|nr:peptidase [Sphingopyxis macrogoltabida]AMU89505.1 peptidase [Sphingopyxis macrogoltabida]